MQILSGVQRVCGSVVTAFQVGGGVDVCGSLLRRPEWWLE